MEAASSSETSVNIYQATRRIIPVASRFIVLAVRTWNLTVKRVKSILSEINLACVAYYIFKNYLIIYFYASSLNQ
jgi:hypothetical protein